MAVAALDEEDCDDFLLLDRLFDVDGELSLDSLVDMDEELWNETEMESLAEVLMLVEANRYLSPRQLYDKSRDFVTKHFANLPDDSFRQLSRMSKASFQFVLSEIEGHPVFRNNSPHSQADVTLQLAVALDRLGNYGNGVSLGRTLKLWGIGKGTCVLYTERVLEALNDLASKYVVWPNKRKRKAMSRRMADKGFKGCVGFIDGTTFPLSQKPAVDGECYFDRKSRYSINGQIVCDDYRRIIAFYGGWPGSCCDSTVYKKMQLAKDAKKPHFFSRGEYLIGDSAYPADRCCNTLVPAYRKNMKGTDIEAFNTCVAHVRVVNEHTIGVLKGRWASLKELRIQLNKKEDMERILRWITACIVLHNMLISQNDDWTSDDESSDEESDEPDEEESEIEDEDDSDDDEFIFRRRLKKKAIRKGKERGGILWYRSNFMY